MSDNTRKSAVQIKSDSKTETLSFTDLEKNQLLEPVWPRDWPENIQKELLLFGAMTKLRNSSLKGTTQDQKAALIKGQISLFEQGLWKGQAQSRITFKDQDLYAILWKLQQKGVKTTLEAIKADLGNQAGAAREAVRQTVDEILKEDEFKEAWKLQEEKNRKNAAKVQGLLGQL